MQVPSPCNSCKNCYWYNLKEDYPYIPAECRLDLLMGISNCPKYEKWTSLFEVLRKEFHGQV